MQSLRVGEKLLLGNSGASRHVTGKVSEFVSYFPNKHNCDTVQTADGTSQPVKGIGSIQCTPTIRLSSVLHVPSFPVNLLSVSSIIDQLNCIVTFDKKMCVFQEKETGRRLGIGIRRDGLWYLDEAVALLAADPWLGSATPSSLVLLSSSPPPLFSRHIRFFLLVFLCYRTVSSHSFYAVTAHALFSLHPRIPVFDRPHRPLTYIKTIQEPSHGVSAPTPANNRQSIDTPSHRTLLNIASLYLLLRVLITAPGHSLNKPTSPLFR